MLGCLVGAQLWACINAHAQYSYVYNPKNKNPYATQASTSYDKAGEDTQKQKLFTVLKELNREKGVYFLFSDQDLATKLVNPVEEKQASIVKILDQVLKNTGLTYKKIADNTYVIVSVADKSNKQPAYKMADFLDAVSPGLSKDEANAHAHYAAITGKVTLLDGSPLPGVSVVVKGSNRGASTNSNGIFKIDASEGETLVFSYVGYDNKEILIGSEHVINVILSETLKQLNEVVVTALGIQRKTKDLTYATQKLNNADLTTVKDANFVNSLTGKVAGVTITKSASGLGGSARVVLRGNKSTRENQPLYVIDGIPLANFTPGQPADVWGQSKGVSGSSFTSSAGRDGGDGISNLNPDDIESITILKGASGAALYGSQAANGAIVITTKSGKAGRTRINFSSDLTAESPMYQPELQFKYGQGLDGAAATSPTTEDSWGPVVNAPDHVKSFYRTGLTTTNAISLTGGTERAQTYFSYANISSKGIVPGSSFLKHNFNFRETAKFFNDRLTVDANISFINQIADNRPVSGLYANPLSGLYLFPRGLDFNYYKNNYQYFSPTRNMYTQNWFDINADKGWGGQDHEQNPYWLLYRAPHSDKRDRAFGNLVLRYKLNEWLTAQARGNFDKSYDTYESSMGAGTQSVQAPPNGRYTFDRTVYTQLYGDFLLTANKNLSKELSLQATLGTSLTDSKTEDQSYDTDPYATQGLYYPNKFGVNFILGDALVSSQTLIHKQQQAVFASVQLGFKNYLYIDLTGRNDWSSTFAFTPTSHKGYFYYSAGANLILSDAFKMPEPVSFSKLRVSYAKVGNDVPAYITRPPDYKQDNRLGAQVNTKAPLPGTYLLPEDNRSFEAGTEWRFFKDKLGIDITYYKNNNYRQYMEVAAPLGSGYSVYYLNLGNIQNTGIEATLYVVPLSTKTFKWTSTINFATNKNKVVSLSDPNITGANAGNAFALTNSNGVNMYYSFIKEGGAWGDIYGATFKRAKDGSIQVDSTGAPLKNSDQSYLGNPNPKFTLGWNNSFEIKNFTISFLVDGRFGGKVMSVTQAILDVYGDSKASAAARDNKGVNMDATISGSSHDGQKWSGPLPAQIFYKAVGGRNGTAEYYMYNATAVRLRELAIGYKLPVHIKGINDIRVSLIGRNLFFFSKKAPFDPEISMATNNGLQGIETFGIPSTRSVGASLKIGF